MYKSCPDLSRLSGPTAPVVNPDTEYRAAYKPSAEHLEHYSTNKSSPAAAAAADNDEDDGVNEVCIPDTV